MLTPEQRTELDHAEGIWNSRWGQAFEAVDAELTAMLIRANGQQHVIDEYGKTVLRMRGENDNLHRKAEALTEALDKQEMVALKAVARLHRTTSLEAQAGVLRKALQEARQSLYLISYLAGNEDAINVWPRIALVAVAAADAVLAVQTRVPNE